MYPGLYGMQAATGLGYAGMELYDDDTVPYFPLRSPGSADLGRSDGSRGLSHSEPDFKSTAFMTESELLNDWMREEAMKPVLSQGHAWPPPINEYSAVLSGMKSQTNSGWPATMQPGACETPFYADPERTRVPTSNLPDTICPAELYRDASTSTPLLVDSDGPEEASDDSPVPSSSRATMSVDTECTTPAQSVSALDEGTPNTDDDDEEAAVDLSTLGDTELLAIRPYGNWACARSDEPRFKKRLLYQLSLKSGWKKLVDKAALQVPKLLALKAEVEADAADMLGKMGERSVDTKEARAVVRVKTVLLSKLDYEIAQREKRPLPTLPAEARDEKAFKKLGRQLRDRDWVSCVWCGKKRPARGDADNIERHAGLGEKSGCSTFAELARRGLLTRWLEQHIRSIYDHDIVQITMNRVAKAAVPASARDLIPASPAPAPAPVIRRNAGRKKAATVAPARKKSNVGPTRTSRTKSRKGQY
ncbi:hypothetical protein AURDEDRAFT_129606 [Auricularia subglabra TFB-10046 SS5]|uniref:Uncharacterized protein n=1 Tax=Auricularia subglabra (strain TFB-10046 / SS5) TaxID=717982 RepID=J0WVM8_AURST|nr:hypothetical protein AURDEDRAFT_129606 [Auricularia subglabra TFB-10046 SS5]